jgi:hypothetical protein
MKMVAPRRLPSASAYIGFAGCAVAAFGVSLFLHGGLPALGDYGDWVYEGVLFRDLLLVVHHPDYIFKHYPVPNSFNTAALGVLMLAMPWQWAAKVYLVLQLAFQFLAASIFFQAVRSVHPGARSEIWFVVPGAVFLGMNFWYGFMNFQTGVAWAMLVCALLLWRARPTSLYSLLLVFTFFTHMIPCAFACLALIFAAWLDRRPRMLWALVAPAFLSGWYLVGRFFYAHNADAHAAIDTKIRYLSGDFFAYKINSFLKSFGFVNPSANADTSLALHFFGDKLFFALFLLNALLAGIFFWLILSRGLRSLRQRSLDAFLWLAIAAFAIVYLVLPGMAMGVSDPGSRALQVALWMAIFLAADSVWPVRIASACAVCLLAANFYLFQKLATSPPQEYAVETHLPAVIAHFGHIPYEDKTQYYSALEQGRFDQSIFPTGVFLRH